MIGRNGQAGHASVLDARTAGLDVARATSRGAVREGMTTGLVGALAVALWFLIVDLLSGRALHTPALLGAVVSGAADPIAAATGAHRLAFAAFYSGVHLTAFTIVGIVAAALVQRAERAPSLLALLLLLFAAVEVAFTGFVAILEVQALGDIAWYQVAAGNVVAALSMGAFLLSRYPQVRLHFAHAFAAADVE